MRRDYQKRPVTAAERSLMIRLSREGRSLSSIARLIHRNKTVVAHHVGSEYRRKQSHCPLDPGIREMVLSMSKEATPYRIAKMTGVHRSTVNYILGKPGWKRS
jgi:hypothetical protein